MEQLAQLYKALSEEMRLRIMMLLMQGELCVCDIQAVMDEPQSKVSRHLAYLKHSGLVSSKRVGVWMHYLIKKSADKTCMAQLAFIEENLSKLPQFGADTKKLQEFQKQKGCEALSPPRREGRTAVSRAGEKGGAAGTKMNTRKTRRK
jgi:ArsR family transcriptional regulator, arsenate/arsenite/antimonite-responsive transcriptional repressor